jgi:protein TonB
MSAAVTHQGWAPDGRVAVRWSASLGFVVLLHSAAAWLLLQPAPALPPDPSPPAVIVDLAPPEPAQEAEQAPEQTPPPEAAATPPEPVAPDPVVPEPPAEPSPPETKAPEAVDPEAVLEQPPTPPVPAKSVVVSKPVVKPLPPKPRPAQRSVSSAPAETAPLDAAPTKAAAASPSPAAAAAVTTSWQGRLQAHIARFKQYPAEARMRHQEGTPTVRFVMTRAGKVLSYRLENGCGHELLDREAKALIERAQPLPPLPDEIPQATIELVLPVRFQLR